MGMKRQDHTLRSNRHVSPHVQCPQIVAETTPTPQQHCQVEVWPLVARTSKNSSKNIILTKRNWQKNKEVINLDLFLGHDRDLTPPPVPLRGGSWDSLRV